MNDELENERRAARIIEAELVARIKALSAELKDLKLLLHLDWRAMREGPPEDRQKCWCYSPRPEPGRQFEARWDAQNEIFWRSYEEDSYSVGVTNVTHWRPLPEKP